MLLQFIHSFKIHFQFSFIYKASKLSKALYFGKKSQQALCDSGKKKLFSTGRSLQ